MFEVSSFSFIAHLLIYESSAQLNDIARTKRPELIDIMKGHMWSHDSVSMYNYVK